MSEEFFSTNDLGLNDQAPKIKAYSVKGVMHFEWDREDPELIAAGINDLTPEEWGIISQLVSEEARSQPVLEITEEGEFWIEPDGTRKKL